MSQQLTIRGVPEDVFTRLEHLSRARRQRMDTTVNQLLADAVGPERRMERLQRYVTWSEQDLAEFSVALAAQRTVSPHS